MERKGFSIEYLLFYFGATAKSVQIHFVITSDAYSKYGPYVTGCILFDRDKLPDLIEKVRNGQNTDGIIMFEERVSDELPANVKEQLMNVGFYASEINSIYFV